MTYTLVLLRHGESDWNAKNLFTGWVDVGLTEKGRAEAVRGGELCARPACCRTSCTPRCCAGRSAPPALPSTRPTGTGSRSAARGASTSVTTARCRARTRSRRSRSTARSSSCSGAAPSTYPRRRSTTTTSSPRSATRATPTSATRCPAPSASRTSSSACCPTGSPAIVPDLRDGKTVLVAAHGNSLRALVKHLDQISDEDIVGLNIPTGMPLVYRLDEYLRPTVARAASTSTQRPLTLPASRASWPLDPGPVALRVVEHWPCTGPSPRVAGPSPPGRATGSRGSRGGGPPPPAAAARRGRRRRRRRRAAARAR